MYSRQSKPRESFHSLDNDFAQASLIEDYDRDHEFILSTIASALKTRDYKTASEFVERYRHVASNDPNFRVLAQMSDDASKRYTQTHDAQLLLEATPEHDYETRAELYQELLKFDPGNADYISGLNACTQELDAMRKDNGRASMSMIRLQDTLLEKDKKIQQCRSHGITVLKIFTIIFGFFLSIAMIAAVAEVDASALSFLLCSALFIMVIRGGFRMMNATLNADLFPGTFIMKNNKYKSPVTIFMVMLAILSIITACPFIFG